MTRWVVRAVVVWMVLLSACSDDPTGPTGVDRVEVGPADQVLVVGDSVTITAVARSAGGEVVSGVVLWRSLSPSVATVRVSGSTAVVEARGAGVARIEAESGGKTGFVNVTVLGVGVVTLVPEALVLEMGQAATIQAQATTSNGAAIEGRAVAWTVAGTGVTIEPAATPGWATMTAHTNGTAVVKATIDGITGEADVQVVSMLPPPAQVATVEITPSGFSLPVDHETSLQAIAKTANGEIVSGLPVTWTSTVETVASITPIGVSPFASLLAKAAGTAVIRATVGGVTGEITLEVTAAPPPAQQILYFYFSPAQRGIWTNQLLDMRQHLRAIGHGGILLDPVATWSVEDPAIAVVDENGNVRGLKKGTTKVYATASGMTATASVTVFQPIEGPVVYDLTYDWWDGQWRMPPEIGTELWTDEYGVDHQVSLWPVSITLTMTADGRYERGLVIRGWVSGNGSSRLVIDREITDAGWYGIMVGGETGYWMHSETTEDVFAVVAAYNAGHLIMRAALGTAADHEYLLRMRQ